MNAHSCMVKRSFLSDTFRAKPKDNFLIYNSLSSRLIEIIVVLLYSKALIMKESIRFVKVIIIMVVFTRCTKPYTIKDNNATIELGESVPFQILLKGDKSPGYNWVLESKPNFIKLETTDKVDDNGSVIDYSFSFKTISYGNGDVKLIYTNG